MFFNLITWQEFTQFLHTEGKNRITAWTRIQHFHSLQRASLLVLHSLFVVLFGFILLQAYENIQWDVTAPKLRRCAQLFYKSYHFIVVSAEASQAFQFPMPSEVTQDFLRHLWWRLAPAVAGFEAMYWCSICHVYYWSIAQTVLPNKG